MVDSHTIAVGTVTLMGVALFIGSMTAVINAMSRLLQAASRLTKMIVTFFKNPLSSALLNIFKKPSGLHFVIMDTFKKPYVFVFGWHHNI